MGRRVYSFDALLLLKDAGLVAASAAAQVASAARVLDMGLNARIDGMVVLDVTAIEIASTDEQYSILVQGSSSPTFASNIQNLAAMQLGATANRPGGGISSLVGRYELPFSNEQADVIYQYVRLYTFIAGTIATGINYRAFMAELPHM